MRILKKIVDWKYFKWFKTIVFVLLLIWVFESLGAWGLGGLIMVWVVFALYRLWQNRQQFMTTLRSIESSIWGVPLDKEYKHLRRKVKWVWRKKKSETDKRG